MVGWSYTIGIGFSMIKHFLFSKTWSDKGGGLTLGGLIPKVPVYHKTKLDVASIMKFIISMNIS